MTTAERFLLPLRPVLVLIAAGCAFGQIGGPSGQSQSTRAAQLPLSGRSAQAGSVNATAAPVPGATTSVNTINPRVQVQGMYTGSSRGTAPFSGKLTLREAIQRGLRDNLGALSVSNQVAQARGIARAARSVLLPNVNSHLSETLQQLNLQASGFRIAGPAFAGFRIPTVVGPFNYFDLRAALSQTVADLTATNNYRAAQLQWQAARFADRDARDLVVFGVAGAYLQAIAASARVQSAQAQLHTADALYRQTSDRRQVGLVAQVDVNRSRVEMLTQRQRLLTLQNDFAKQKINLARMTGLPPDDHYELADDVPFSAAPPIVEDEAIVQAARERADLRSAEAQVQAAGRALAAARAERLPSLALTADYGAIGVNPAQAHGTFAIVGTLRVPVWQGGRIQGDIEQASATLAQRRAELEDLQAQVEAEVRTAYLDLEAAASQVAVARDNIQVATQNLELSRQRFDAGVADNLEVIRSQEALAGADLDNINAVFAHNLAKLGLARAMGRTSGDLSPFLQARPR